MNPADVQPAARIRGGFRLNAVHRAEVLGFDLARNRGRGSRGSAVYLYFRELPCRPGGVRRDLNSHVARAGGRKVNRHRVGGARIKRIAGRGLQISEARSVRTSLHG
ncbi:hypothetical protein D3C74_273760 [compost metagenome]